MAERMKSKDGQMKDNRKERPRALSIMHQKLREEDIVSVCFGLMLEIKYGIKINKTVKCEWLCENEC